MTRCLLTACLALGLTLSTFGCGSAPVIGVSVSPALVCPGEAVTIRLQTQGHSGGRVTVSTPPPESGFSNSTYDRATNPRVDERFARICTTTTWTLKAWNGEETDCGTNYTTCDSATASVAFDDVVVERSRETCTEVGIFELTEAEFGSFQIRGVRNCTSGGRSVELTNRSGRTAVIPGSGILVADFNGQPLVGSYTARRTLIPPEGCPPPSSTVPRPAPPPPPPICLQFVAGCEASEVCAEG